jgi:acetylglutamate kinase
LRFTVKLGGSILEDAGIRRGILGQVSALEREGHEIILVHGGGKSLTRRLEELRIQSRFIEGLRVTDAQTLAVAVMVLAGEVNKSLVSELQAMGSSAIGICGADGAAVRCRPIAGTPGFSAELGFVGQPVSVNRALFKLLLGGGLVPVVSSIAYGEDGQLFNVNADQMASICAWGTRSKALIYLTDVAGVKDKSGAVIRWLDPGKVAALRADGTLTGGMLPKTSSCLEAIEHGVGSVYILPGATPDILHTVVGGAVSEGTCINANA